MNVSPEQEQRLSAHALDQVIAEHGARILSAQHPISRAVQRIADRIAEALHRELGIERRWPVRVIDCAVPNAFVLPTGDIFVFTGLLAVCAGEPGLATVLGHEMAHAVARHAAEKMSVWQLLFLGAMAVQLVVGSVPLADLCAQLLLALPFSRRCEREADYIGLLMMAKAGYDPREAVELWKRMETMEKNRKALPFLSTHPSHADRVESIQSWMKEAMEKYREGREKNYWFSE